MSEGGTAAGASVPWPSGLAIGLPPTWLLTSPELVSKRLDKQESEKDAVLSLLQWVQATETNPAAVQDRATQA